MIRETEIDAGDVATPPAGTKTLFLDEADGEFKTKDSSATVESLTGAAGADGADGAGYLATSTTSLATAGSGSKVFTTQAGLAYSAGARIRATSVGTAEWMEGVVTSYVTTTLTVTMDLNSGTGTHADWNINLAGQRGATGATGATGGAGPETCAFRLTLETGVPISTTDQTAKTTIYATPYKGNTIALWDGAAWAGLTSAEVSIALGTLTSGKNYDVFAYDNTGTLTLEFSAAWSNDTTRTDALALQDGVLVKSGTPTRRYLGTFRTTSTTTTEDSAGGSTTNVGGKRFLWNYYNRVERQMKVIDTTSAWSYGTDTWRQARANAGNQVEYVCGVNEEMVKAFNTMTCSGSSNAARSQKISIGLDSTSTPSRFVASHLTAGATNVYSAVTAQYAEPAGLGYHFLAQLEKGADGTSNFAGDVAGSGNEQTGLVAWING